MPFAFDHLLLARILFTPMTAGYAVATIIADVVWQITSYIGFGLLSLVLIWWPGPLAVERLYLAAIMGAIVYAAFFVAVVTMPVYGGAAYDDNGYQPFAAPVPVFAKSWDVNITAFSVQLVIWVAGLTATLSG